MHYKECLFILILMLQRRKKSIFLYFKFIIEFL